MNYHGELDFLRNILNKCRVRSVIICDGAEIDHSSDVILANILSDSYNPSDRKISIGNNLLPSTIYRHTDQFGCRYIYTLLPEYDSRSAFVIGPYKTKNLTNEEFLELSESMGLDAGSVKDAEMFYNNIPFIGGEDSLFTVIDSFAERIWGENYTLVDLDAVADFSLPISVNSSASDSKKIDFESMEMRYSVENQLMDAVSKGQHHKLELLFGSFTGMSFEKRLADPVRNLKNYCIIMNTLLRKAAENGGVHPFYLDKVSSDFATKIENLQTVVSAQALMKEMFRYYCFLVNKHATNNYSAPVRKAILYIDADIASDLSLSKIASNLTISPSYLSTIFKQETGQTLTDYVNTKRIKLAKHLLKTTKLQIQTISQHCGMVDVHYFSKLFKRYTDMTPIEYRKSTNVQKIYK